MHLMLKETTKYDLLSLGEVMLRLDPGDDRIRTAVQFRAWEGGGEYNVAKALSACFGMRTGIVTAIGADEVGALLLNRMRQGGVDTQYVMQCRGLRNGLNFTEKGFGVRGALGVSDRRFSAASQMQVGDVDWDRIFSQGVRILHTGGIFAALSASSAAFLQDAVRCAKKHNVAVSYDLNYRASLWNVNGGMKNAHAVNRSILPYVDILFGNETDYADALGIKQASFAECAQAVREMFPNVQVLATSLRTVHSASRNDWSGQMYADGKLLCGKTMKDIEIFDRVGGGDSFASGVLYGMLSGMEPKTALEYGIAHGALVMTTPGDTSMATLPEVEALMHGQSPRIIR